MGSIKKKECKFPVNEPGNDLLNILICVHGKDCNLPDIRPNDEVSCVGEESVALAMFRAIRDP